MNRLKQVRLFIYMVIFLIANSLYLELWAIPDKANIECDKDSKEECFLEGKKIKISWNPSFKEDLPPEKHPTTWTAVDIVIGAIDGITNPGASATAGEVFLEVHKPGRYEIDVKVIYKADNPNYANEPFTKKFIVTFVKVEQFNVKPEKSIICKNSPLTKEDFVIEVYPSNASVSWSRESTGVEGNRKAFLKIGSNVCAETEFRVVGSELVEDPLVPNPLNNGPVAIIKRIDIELSGAYYEYYYDEVITTSVNSFKLVKDFGLSACNGSLSVTQSSGHQVSGSASFGPIFKKLGLDVSYQWNKQTTIEVSAPPATENKKVGLRTHDQKVRATTRGDFTKIRYVDSNGNIGQWKTPSDEYLGNYILEVNESYGPVQRQGYWACCNQ